MTFRGRLTLFLIAIVLAPLVAAGVAAHVLAQRQAAREADDRLEKAELVEQRAQTDLLYSVLQGLTSDVAGDALEASGRQLEQLRRARGLDFLFVAHGGRATSAAMGHPAFESNYELGPRAILQADFTPAPVELRQFNVDGRPSRTVVGGRYLDRRFLRRLPVPAMEVVRGRVVASTVPAGPSTVAERMFFDLPDGRRGLCLCSDGAPSGTVLVTTVHHIGLFPDPSPWLFLLAIVGIVLGSALAFELARVLSRPHERALDRLEETERLSVTDGLTGLPNRRFLGPALLEETRRATRFDRPFSVLMIDIDHFKRINDTYGHAVGDRVLIEVAERIRSSVRPDLDVAARFGGEEFTVVLPETGADGAAVVAERIRGAVAGAPVADGLTATISVGVATWARDGSSPEELLVAADRALYEAKRSGRDRVAVLTT